MNASILAGRVRSRNDMRTAVDVVPLALQEIGAGAQRYLSVTMRTKPVRREEVRFDEERITTLPADSLRQGQFDREPIPKLWAPLLRSLKAQTAVAVLTRQAQMPALWLQVLSGAGRSELLLLRSMRPTPCALPSSSRRARRPEPQPAPTASVKPMVSRSRRSAPP